MLQKIRRLLFIRLLLIFVATTLSILVAVYIALELSRSADYLEPTRNNLSRYVEYLVDDIGVPPNINVAKKISDSALIEIAIIYGDRIWKSKPDLTFPEGVKEAINRPQFLHQDHAQFYFLSRGPFTFVFSIPDSRRYEFHPYLPFLLLGMISLILFISYKTVGKLFRPIQWIKEGAQRISQGDLSYRLPENGEDELGELTIEINHMAEEVQKLLEAKRQLLLAISHELRSPITRATVTLEFIQDEKIRESLRQDLESMEKLTQELLETEKLSSGHSQLNRKNENLTVLVDEVIKENFSEQRSKIHFQADSQELVASVDVVRIKLVIKNLIENAFRHQREGQAIDLSLQKVDAQIVFSVKDYGVGIAPEHLPYLMQAFYRADASRQRKTGGYGLGLYLCRLVIEAHGGKIDIESRVNEGTCVRFSLPTNS
ncbi:MAG: sensor histidine kinase [Bdellovibrionota bacterium]